VTVTAEVVVILARVGPEQKRQGRGQPRYRRPGEEVSPVKTLLCILLLLIVGVAALGLNRGWFTFATLPDQENGRPGVEFRIDENKVKSDIQKAKDKVTGPSHSAKEREGGN
jgi:hypothetical protein